MNVACDYEAPMQMLTTEKYIASGTAMKFSLLRKWVFIIEMILQLSHGHFPIFLPVSDHVQFILCYSF